MESYLEFEIKDNFCTKQLDYLTIKLALGKIFYSQATQDIFVLKMLVDKIGGFYLEIGGGHPQDSSNTYLLESKYHWDGFALEKNNQLVKLYNAGRRNPAIDADATLFDYQKKLESINAPSQIDYLSVDIDPVENSYLALKSLPHDNYRFSVITFEHDRYKSGDKYMLESRNLLNSLGYKLVVKNVMCFGRDFEDWWIDPFVIPKEIWKPKQKKRVEFAKLWV